MPTNAVWTMMTPVEEESGNGNYAPVMCIYFKDHQNQTGEGVFLRSANRQKARGVGVGSWTPHGLCKTICPTSSEADKPGHPDSHTQGKIHNAIPADWEVYCALY